MQIIDRGYDRKWIGSETLEHWSARGYVPLWGDVEYTRSTIWWFTFLKNIPSMDHTIDHVTLKCFHLSRLITRESCCYQSILILIENMLIYLLWNIYISILYIIRFGCNCNISRIWVRVDIGIPIMLKIGLGVTLRSVCFLLWFALSWVRTDLFNLHIQTTTPILISWQVVSNLRICQCVMW